MLVNISREIATVDQLYELAVGLGWHRDNPYSMVSAKEKVEASKWYIKRLVSDAVQSKR